MFGAEPGGDNSSTGEPHKKRRLATNEGSGDAPFFSEICVFADLRVMARFFEAGDALEAADGVFIENIVVADPELEGKAGANWNEAVKNFVVADWEFAPAATADDDPSLRAPLHEGPLALSRKLAQDEDPFAIRAGGALRPLQSGTLRQSHGGLPSIPISS